MSEDHESDDPPEPSESQPKTFSEIWEQTPETIKEAVNDRISRGIREFEPSSLNDLDDDDEYLKDNE